MKSARQWGQVLSLALGLAALLLPPNSTHAAPAPWYLWQSRATGEWLCTQLSPGDAWVLSAGPFRNAACKG